ncbi:hypothetical protein OQX61_00220 [Pedobacter sp. PLR]|nr:hypothetical protein [Pedobacter sp. PLR]
MEVIEERLGWGSGKEWTGQDFERLSVEIKKGTGVILSVTTLKRLWGKLKYTNVPTTTTLNTLAKFAGYDNWRTFKHQKSLEETPVILPEARSAAKNANKKFLKSKYWLPGLISLLIIGCLVFFSNAEIKAPANHTAYVFRSNKIKMEGVPNSVVFNFNAAAAGTDSVFIAQSWDLNRKVAVSPLEHIHSAIYYNPGYYRAKLIVGNQIVKEHDLMISSGGWLAMVENNGGVPLYFKTKEVLTKNKVEVNEDLLSRYNIPLQPSLPKLRFFNVRDIAGIQNNHFIFETTLKSDFNQGTAACQRVDVLILCKDDVISYRFVPKAV